MRRMIVDVLGRMNLVNEALRARSTARAWSEHTIRQIRSVTAPRSLRRIAASDDALISCTVLTSDRRWRAVVARRRVDPSVVSAIESNHDLVTRCLRIAGVAHRRMAVETTNRWRVAVAVEDRQRVLDALRRHAPPGTYVYVDDASVPRRWRLHHLAAAPTRRLRRLGRQAEVWRVFEFLADPDGTDVHGDLHGCEVEFWVPTGADSLAAPRSNREVTTLRRKELTEVDAVRTDAGPYLPTDRIDFPIDLVYTWVDGSDPSWIERRSDALEHDSVKRHREAGSAARYTSYDELRYSLRSVEKYADFVNHVYLVTDDQRPEWLVDHHPRLTLVSHREIFPRDSDLPTFNSHAIESRLHHVPDLAEHYVYMNDDFLFWRRIAPDRFFLGNGMARFFPSRALVPPGPVDHRTKPVDAAAMNGRDLVAEKFGRTPTQKMKHAPYPQLRTVNLEIEQMFPERVAETTSSRVRGPHDLSIASFLSHHVAFLTAQAVPGDIDSRYVDLGEPSLAMRLRDLRRRHNFDSLCLNDSDSEHLTPAAKREMITEFLEACFPEPSSFERR